jgi:hypothetical protein
MTYVHVALFAWKHDVQQSDIDRVMSEVASLQDKVPGVLEIFAGENHSKYSEGYSHVVMVRGESQEAIDAYRSHPDHVKVAAEIDSYELKGVGVDFATKDNVYS